NKNIINRTASINLSDIEYINSLKGLFFNNPLLTLSLSICLFSFAGVPPLIGFFAKQQVLYSSNSAGYFFLSLIAILVSVISAFYYLKIIKILHSLPLNLSTASSLESFDLKTKDLEKEVLASTSHTEPQQALLTYQSEYEESNLKALNNNKT